MASSAAMELVASVQRGVLGFLLAFLGVMAVGVTLDAYQNGQILYGIGGLLGAALAAAAIALLFYEGYSDG